MSRPTRNSVALIIGLVMAVAAVATSGQAEADKFIFHPFDAVNVEGDPIRFPAGLAGDLNLVVLSFAPGQDEAAETYTPFIRTMMQTEPRLANYEAAIVPDPGAAGRLAMTTSARLLVTDEARRLYLVAWFAPPEERAAFLAGLGVPDNSDVYAVLVDRTGAVHWRVKGPFDDAKGASLKAAVAAVLPALAGN